jgi:hypothetical protein
MSVTKPASTDLRVDFVSTRHLSLPGKLGLTTMPGRICPSGTGKHVRDLDGDLAHMRGNLSVRHLVSLMLTSEYDSHAPALDATRTAARRHGIAFDHFPFPSGDVPPPASSELYLGLVTIIIEQLRRGEHVVVHSRGGRGRCGLVVGSVLVATGMDADEAIGVVEATRKGAIDNESQRTFIRAFAGVWKLARHELTSIVQDALRESGWKFTTSQQDDVVRLDVGTSSSVAEYMVAFTIMERARCVCMVVRLPIEVAVEHRYAASALLGHLNSVRALGSFEMSLRGGEIRFRAELQVGDGMLGRRAVQATLVAALHACDQELPLIAKVSSGGADPMELFALTG